MASGSRSKKLVSMSFDNSNDLEKDQKAPYSEIESHETRSGGRDKNITASVKSG
tara:strand:+ start:129 stop:290 length:162 start_codon:yes stop_codon:yes gene_type:complete